MKPAPTPILLALGLLTLVGACKPSGGPPVVVQAEAAPAVVVAPPDAVQRAFLRKVEAALKSRKAAALQALVCWDNASERARQTLPGVLKQETEDCDGRHPCECSLIVTPKFAGMKMSAPSFGELVIEHKSADMVTHTKIPVGVKDGVVMLVTEAQ